MADSGLRTYLNDHLAGSINAIELARHAAGERSGTELGAFLAELADEIEADRNALLEVMESLGASVDHPKQVLAWGLEKAMRLKYHSPLSSRGPLTTMLELETLLLGIVGKLSLWRALAEALGLDPRLEELIARAERQREAVERHRLAAGREVLATGA